jgi:hypothetical protein
MGGGAAQVGPGGGGGGATGGCQAGGATGGAVGGLGVQDGRVGSCRPGVDTSVTSESGAARRSPQLVQNDAAAGTWAPQLGQATVSVNGGALRRRVGRHHHGAW